MEHDGFHDFYEVLQVSSTASEDTIEKMFRHLAQRYHPDNKETGDVAKFQEVVEAHKALGDREKRAQYDLLYNQSIAHQYSLVQHVTGNDSLDSDIRIQSVILNVLYHKCRENCKKPGFGLYQLRQMLDCSMELLDFHIWYMKERGWVRRTEDGMLAITVQGCDKAIEDRQQQDSVKRITDQSDRVIHL